MGKMKELYQKMQDEEKGLCEGYKGYGQLWSSEYERDKLTGRL